jgi:hypothetical protein
MGFKTSIKGSIFYDNIGVPEEVHAAIVGGKQVSRYPVVRAYYYYVVQDQ